MKYRLGKNSATLLRSRRKHNGKTQASPPLKFPKGFKLEDHFNRKRIAGRIREEAKNLSTTEVNKLTTKIIVSSLRAMLITKLNPIKAKRLILAEFMNYKKYSEKTNSRGIIRYKIALEIIDKFEQSLPLDYSYE